MRQERDCQAFSKEKGGRDPVFWLLFTVSQNLSSGKLKKLFFV